MAWCLKAQRQLYLYHCIAVNVPCVHECIVSVRAACISGYLCATKITVKCAILRVLEASNRRIAVDIPYEVKYTVNIYCERIFRPACRNCYS
jgi:hypothetical protein